MFKKIAIGLAAVIVILLVVIMTRPSSYRVERSTQVDAAPAEVFAQVNDLRKWQEWSPWEKRDPDMERTFSGAEEGVGAAYSWSGNKEVGKGRMSIVESREPEWVKLELEFIEPFASTADTAFEIVPEGEGSVVTWSMSGENDFMGKAFSLVMDVEDMVGKDYEKGLANLKALVETEETDGAEEADGAEPGGETAEATKG